MRNTKQNVIFAITCFILLFSIWIWSNGYLSTSVTTDDTYAAYVEKLKEGVANIKVGMTREDVERIILVPPDEFSFDSPTGSVTWAWNAGKHLSSGSQDINFSETKGFFMVTIIFSKEGTVEKIYSGVN